MRELRSSEIKSPVYAPAASCWWGEDLNPGHLAYPKVLLPINTRIAGKGGFPRERMGAHVWWKEG